MDIAEEARALCRRLDREAASLAHAERITEAWLTRFAARVLEAEVERLNAEAAEAERSKAQQLLLDAQGLYRIAKQKKRRR